MTQGIPGGELNSTTITTATVAMERTQPAALQQKPRRKVKYATLFWVVFIILALLFIIDRLTINIVPRQAFNIPSLGYTTGTDHHDFPTSPWTATLHEIVSRLSGRYNMVALNALFFTMMHTLHAKMASSRLADYIDFSDHSAPIIIHEKIGLSICIVTIIHVWGILFPTLFEGYSVGVTVGTLTFPLSERAPGFISRDIDEVARKVTMQADDAWRLVSMTVFLGPLMYICVRWLRSRYRLGIRLHQFIMMAYFIDIIRRHTHPHTWVLNVPVFLIWLGDNILGLYYHHQSVKMRKLVLSPHYSLLYWKNNDHIPQNEESQSSVGSHVRINGIGNYKKGDSFCTFEPRHPFTIFTRRSLRLKSVIAEDWDHAIVARMYNGKYSYTKKIQGEELENVHVWGPFQARAVPDAFNDGHHTLLVGGGSGSGYLVDSLIYIASMPDTSHLGNIRLVFTTREIGVIRFWVAVINEIHEQSPLPASLHVTMALTSGGGESHSEADLDSGTTFPWGKVQFGRCNLEHEASAMRRLCAQKDNGRMFCQGSGALMATASRAAWKYGHVFHGSRVFDDGPAKSNDSSSGTVSESFRAGPPMEEGELIGEKPAAACPIEGISSWFKSNEAEKAHETHEMKESQKVPNGAPVTRGMSAPKSNQITVVLNPRASYGSQSKLEGHVNHAFR